jgi:lipopolysaccharide export system protein LptA
MPALLDADERVFVTATNLRYDPDTGLAAYTGGARLWQGDTSFSGDTIALDDHTGGLAVEGDVRTRIQLVRVTETGEQPQNSLTTAEASTFLYDDSGRHALYEEGATLLSDAGDLKADRIDVFLESDGRTLDRLEATGNVKIRLDGRWAIGESLVYREAEGRYEMEGAPVEIVEEVEPSETPVAVSPPRENTLPAPPSCNTTKGRSLTFYRSNDTISVDGREEYRTQSNSGVCNPLVF